MLRMKLTENDFGKSLNSLLPNKATQHATFIIVDEDYDNIYKIRTTPTNIGLNIQCWLDEEISYQAQQNNAGSLKIYEIVNAIAGGTVADKKGFINQ